MSEKFAKWAKEGKNSKYMWLIIGLVLLVLGITFWPMGSSKGSQTQTVVRQTTIKESQSYEDALEKKLASILSKMEGVGEVNVMVTIVSNEEKVLAEDTTTNVQRTEEKDQAGGTRVSDTNNTSRQVVLQNNNTPYIVKQNAPVIKGVLILAQGAGDSGVKESVTNAVASLLDVPVHKISVEKRK
ncbi:hypothetical protein QTL86_08620 [Cellulosilyticum sp. ST5]|uniref:hypothetical protein n=1 Tax=unclassified Cellulosilyticum TaxID=2643091 RepID=UPI000F8D1F13|nr:hypothetical protein [Cellulosilyticum sp. WCF-2]QEH68917.1 hypothetical protein EKH84_11185 [Cellulosilyticum sp. WCF-2]